jgi:hypothetical protein
VDDVVFLCNSTLSGLFEVLASHWPDAAAECNSDANNKDNVRMDSKTIAIENWMVGAESE